MQELIRDCGDFDPSVCFICGEKAEWLYEPGENDMCCHRCDVWWRDPKGSWAYENFESDEQWLSALAWKEQQYVRTYHIEFIDFTKPGALSCPA